MGIDLTLYPLDMFPDMDSPGKRNFFPFTKLSMTRRYEMHDALKEAGPRPLDGEMFLYEDEGARYVFEDAYGDPLTYLPAHLVVKALEKLGLGGVNRSVLAYLREADSMSMVILYWH